MLNWGDIEDKIPEKWRNKVLALLAVILLAAPLVGLANDAKSLIADGRVEEGLSLLESEAETDSEQAARHWRELGVLLSNRSVLRAIAAYEKSLASNPEQFSVNIALIRLYLTSGDLEQAQRQIAAADMNRTTRREHSVLLDEKGYVKRDSGDSQGALADYREGLKIRRALVEDDPANAERRRDLSVSLDRIGDVKRASGDFQGALADYRESLKISRALAQDDPANAERRTPEGPKRQPRKNRRREAGLRGLPRRAGRLPGGPENQPRTVAGRPRKRRTPERPERQPDQNRPHPPTTRKLQRSLGFLPHKPAAGQTTGANRPEQRSLSTGFEDHRTAHIRTGIPFQSVGCSLGIEKHGARLGAEPTIRAPSKMPSTPRRFFAHC